MALWPAARRMLSSCVDIPWEPRRDFFGPLGDVSGAPLRYPVSSLGGMRALLCRLAIRAHVDSICVAACVLQERLIRSTSSHLWEYFVIHVDCAIPPTPRRMKSLRRSWNLYNGLRSNPPPCLGWVPGASWMNMRVSWDVSLGPLWRALGSI